MVLDYARTRGDGRRSSAQKILSGATVACGSSERYRWREEDQRPQSVHNRPELAQDRINGEH